MKLNTFLILILAGLFVINAHALPSLISGTEDLFDESGSTSTVQSLEDSLRNLELEENMYDKCMLMPTQIESMGNVELTPLPDQSSQSFLSFIAFKIWKTSETFRPLVMSLISQLVPSRRVLTIPYISSADGEQIEQKTFKGFESIELFNGEETFIIIENQDVPEFIEKSNYDVIVIDGQEMIKVNGAVLVSADYLINGLQTCSTTAMLIWEHSRVFRPLLLDLLSIQIPQVLLHELIKVLDNTPLRQHRHLIESLLTNTCQQLIPEASRPAATNVSEIINSVFGTLLLDLVSNQLPEVLLQHSKILDKTPLKQHRQRIENFLLKVISMRNQYQQFIPGASRPAAAKVSESVNSSILLIVRELGVSLSLDKESTELLTDFASLSISLMPLNMSVPLTLILALIFDLHRIYDQKLLIREGR